MEETVIRGFIVKKEIGEVKGLASTLAVYLNAPTSKCIQLDTRNDSLAQHEENLIAQSACLYSTKGTKNSGMVKGIEELLRELGVVLEESQVLPLGRWWIITCHTQGD